MNVGFIGLGHMGRGMAINLRKAGHDVRAWNRTREATADLASKGISMTTTRTETAVEVTYLAQIASWLALQPDFQYVIHSNTDLSVHNGLAFQVRFEMAF